MPNNCQNILTISGSNEDLKVFEQQSEDGKFQLTHYYPLPKSEKDNWYMWQIENWGTKWDVYESRAMWLGYGDTPEAGTGDLTMDAADGKITISFLSAWSPPSKGIEYISGIYPTLSFTLLYVEVGNDFAGIDIYNEGQRVSSEEGSVEDFITRYDFALAF